jgi:hypothetical protein
MSMRAAINAKCKDCIYDDCAPGNWRQQVAACTISTCSLHPYRPKSKPRASQVAGESSVPNEANLATQVT